MPVNIGKLATESGKDSLEPLVCLLGGASETRVVVEGVEMTALVDTWSQISAHTDGFCKERGLKILPLRNLIKGVLHLEGKGGITIPYNRYLEANLTIPDLPHYNEDVLFLLVANHICGDKSTSTNRHPIHRSVSGHCDQK